MPLVAPVALVEVVAPAGEVLVGLAEGEDLPGVVRVEAVEVAAVGV